MGALPQDLEQTKILGMGQFDIIDGPVADEDKIVIYLGRNLTDEQYNRVVKSIAAFVYEQLPNVVHVGINS